MKVRENSDELTLRAEEVGTLKTRINVDHIDKCQAFFKGIEGEDWGEVYDSYKEMSRAVGVKKPQEAQKAKALWKMKAAEDAGEEYHDPTREDYIRRRNETRQALWEEHLKDPIDALDKAL